MGLETGEWCRCRSLPITPPASLRSHGSRPRPTRHIPPSPLAGRGVPTRLRSTPPLPPLPGGARQGGRGIPGGKDRRGERKGDGRMRSDRGEREKINKKISVRFPGTLPLGPQPAERFTRGAMRWYWTSLVDGLMLLRLLAVGGGSSGRGQPAASPPFPAPPQTWRMAAGFGLQANGGRLLRSLLDGSHPSSTQEHGSESSVPPVLLLLQHHRFGQPLAVSASSCCPISSAPRSPSAARAL